MVVVCYFSCQSSTKGSSKSQGFKTVKVIKRNYEFIVLEINLKLLFRSVSTVPRLSLVTVRNFTN